MSDELKPCPFCEGVAEILDAYGESWAVCTNEKCCASGPSRATSDGARTIWNRRTTPAPRAVVMPVVPVFVDNPSAYHFRQLVTLRDREWTDVIRAAGVDVGREHEPHM